MSLDDEIKQSASILDKTDWRKSIHKYLDNCVAVEGTLKYPQSVKSLVSAVAGTFPNWDAKKAIDGYIKKLNEEYKQKIDKFVSDNPDYWVHPGKRLTIEPDIVNAYYRDIFNFIFNMLAEKRMLLWGGRTITGGTQMED